VQGGVGRIGTTGPKGLQTAAAAVGYTPSTAVMPKVERGSQRQASSLLPLPGADEVHLGRRMGVHAWRMGEWHMSPH